MICQACLDENYTICSDCNNWVFNDDIRRTANGNCICESCYENHYFTCQGCDEIHHYDNEHDEDGYCNSCHHSRNHVHDYGYKPFPQFQGNPLERHYGVELEVACEEETQEEFVELSNDWNEEFYPKHDGSLDEGCEIVTHPFTLAFHQQWWKKFFKHAPQHPNVTGWSNGECGIHVHIERKGLSTMTISKMVVFVNDPNNYPFIRKIAQRSKNHYSQVCDKKLNRYLVSGSDRYDAVNTSNRKTIEIRLFRSSYRLDRILKAVEFCDALVQFCQVTSYRKLNVKEFLLWVKHQPKKFYKHLMAFMTEKEIWAMEQMDAPKVSSHMSVRTPADYEDLDDGRAELTASIDLNAIRRHGVCV